MATTAPVIVSPSPSHQGVVQRLPVQRLPEAVRRQMIAAHCAALCAWLNRMAATAEQGEEGSLRKNGRQKDEPISR